MRLLLQSCAAAGSALIFVSHDARLAGTFCATDRSAATEPRRPARGGSGMSALLNLAAHSAWNRRFVLSLIVLSIALSTFLLLGIERIRADVRENFSQSVSGTDLIVGARTGSVQLLLYSVFHIGAASNNIRWQSAQAVAQNRAVAWMVPISLGDSHRGFPVVASTRAYFEHFQYGDHQPLRIARGQTLRWCFRAGSRRRGRAEAWIQAGRPHRAEPRRWRARHQ